MTPRKSAATSTNNKVEIEAPLSRPRGRPPIYTTAIAVEICERLSKCESLRAICRDEHMPDESTVRIWALENREGFFPHYARARDFGADAMADELLEIVDDGRNDWVERQTLKGPERVLDHEHVARSKLRADTRRWLMAKMAPKKYGDKLQHTGADGSGPVLTRVEYSWKDALTPLQPPE